jgi:hypothetical protein
MEDKLQNLVILSILLGAAAVCGAILYNLVLEIQSARILSKLADIRIELAEKQQVIERLRDKVKLLKIVGRRVEPIDARLFKSCEDYLTLSGSVLHHVTVLEMYRAAPKKQYLSGLLYDREALRSRYKDLCS